MPPEQSYRSPTQEGAFGSLRLPESDLPQAIKVFRDRSRGATATFLVLLDYDWRDRVLASGFYVHDARAVAYCIAAVCEAAGHRVDLDLDDLGADA